uniref:Uncharacterized protein n=1 Tax=viral metagenome TaxID=1070528 RepID=A0A6C0BDA9_9ZZZZ
MNDFQSQHQPNNISDSFQGNTPDNSGFSSIPSYQHSSLQTQLFQNPHEQYHPSQLSNPIYPPSMQVPGLLPPSYGFNQQTHIQDNRYSLPQSLPINLAQKSPIINSAPSNQFLTPFSQQNTQLPNPLSTTSVIQNPTFQQPFNPMSSISVNHNPQNGHAQFLDPNASKQQSVQPVQFGVDIKSSGIPKLIALAEAPGGNIQLYEVTKLVILMVTNPSNMVINIPSIRRNDKSYDTPQGPKSGYVFYKNQADHISTLDQLFPGSDWRTQLIEPLPDVAKEKKPDLLWSGNLNYGGRNCSFYLYEYSDKSLTVFSPIDFSQSLKPWSGLKCPHVDSGKQNGYLAYKNSQDHMNYLKGLLPGVDFEALYKQSQPKVGGAPVSIKRDPIQIFEHEFMYNGSNFKIEIFEYSDVSIAVFTTPLFDFCDFRRTNNILHPNQGPREGVIIAKNNKADFDKLKGFIGKQDLESLFVMEPEKSDRGSMFGTKSSVLSGGNSISSSTITEMKPRSYEDIPIDTLVRILRSKINNLSALETKTLVGDEVMISGLSDEVDKQKELYTDATISIEIRVGDRSISIIKT